MKILLASGILPPDIGGPATYASSLAAGFRDLGHSVTALAYGSPAPIPGVRTIGVRRRGNRLLNLLSYSLQVLRSGRSADGIMAFDIMSSGLPTVLACLTLRKRPVMRLGGDFFWERDVNLERVFCPLGEYYSKGLHRKGIAYPIARFVMGRLGLLVFTATYLEDIYLRAFPVLRGRTRVIENPYPDVEGERVPEGQASEDGPFRFLYAGRLVRLKNLRVLIRVFRDLILENRNVSLEICGEGPEEDALRNLVLTEGLEGAVRICKALPHGELMTRILSVDACILPSLAEISPNFGLECLKLGRPLIITRNTGMQDLFQRHACQVDPMNYGEIREKVSSLALAPERKGTDPVPGDELLSRTWNDVCLETLEALNPSR